MVINNFSSYFEILTGANLGFAAFNYFKEDLKLYLHNFILHNRKYIALSSTIYALTAEGTDENTVLHIYGKKIENTRETLIDEVKAEQRFVSHLEPLSLLLGLYCIFLLVIGGFQQEQLLTESDTNNIIVMLSTLIVVFSYLVFCGSFITRLVINNIKISFIGIIFSFIILVCSSLIIFYNVSSVNVILILLIIIPVILYTSFISYLLLTCNSFDKINEEYKSEIYDENELKKLKRRNNIAFIVSSLLTIVFLILPPIVLYFTTNTQSGFNDVIIYFITLTLPMLLFVFFFIRTLRS
jgi:hypothetical protein